MSKLSFRDKLYKCYNKFKLAGKSFDLLTAFVGHSHNCVIPEYSIQREFYIDSLFGGDRKAYFEALKELSDRQLIRFNEENDKMVLLVLHDSHMNNLLYGLKEPSGSRYTREPIKQQQGLLDILTSGSLGQIVTTALTKAAESIPEFSYRFKDCGFKVPESLMPYFTGQPLPYRDKENMLRIDPERVELEENRRNLPKHSIIAFCACLAFMDQQGIIEDCTEHSLFQSFLKEFGEDSFCVQTWYNSIDRLMELRLIEKFYDEKKDCPCIRVLGIDEAFNERYVIVPYVVFEDDFKRLETAGIRIFFDIVFALNNGENKREDGSMNVIGQDKAYFFKVAKLDTEKPENRKKFEDKLLQFKKRYPGELRSAMFGDAVRSSQGDPEHPEIKEEEFRALSKYFHFHYTSGTALMVRIRREYYISKASEKLKKQLSLEYRYKRKLDHIKGLMDGHSIEHNEKDLLDFIKVFRKQNRRTTTIIIGILAERIRLYKEHGWNKIESLGAYVRTVLNEYLQGNLKTSQYLIPTES